MVSSAIRRQVSKAWNDLRKRSAGRSTELRATADDDGFVLSLSPQHSFPLESMFGILNTRNVRLLEQALLRADVSDALALERHAGPAVRNFRDSKKVPRPLAVPQTTCSAVFRSHGLSENVTGDLVPVSLARRSCTTACGNALEGLRAF